MQDAQTVFSYDPSKPFAARNGLLASPNVDLLGDNGKGIGEGQISGADSLGILGMRERILALDGKLRIEGAAGGGTTVTVGIPLRGDGVVRASEVGRDG